jgi:hypothetical protein
MKTFDEYLKEGTLYSEENITVSLLQLDGKMVNIKILDDLGSFDSYWGVFGKLSKSMTIGFWEDNLKQGDFYNDVDSYKAWIATFTKITTKSKAIVDGLLDQIENIEKATDNKIAQKEAKKFNTQVKKLIAILPK